MWSKSGVGHIKKSSGYTDLKYKRDSGLELRGEHTGNQPPKFSSYLLHLSGGKKLNSLFFKYSPPNNNHKLMDSAELKKKKTTATKRRQ